jgi:hypothetical protein
MSTLSRKRPCHQTFAMSTLSRNDRELTRPPRTNQKAHVLHMEVCSKVFFASIVNAYLSHMFIVMDANQFMSIL